MQNFEKGPQFALSDLLALELHNHVEGVTEVSGKTRILAMNPAKWLQT